jgi:hypothetical protein
MGHGAWSTKTEVRGQLPDDRRQRAEDRIADCETGNLPEGWESAGQLRIAKPGTRPKGGSPQDN